MRGITCADSSVDDVRKKGRGHKRPLVFLVQLPLVRSFLLSRCDRDLFDGPDVQIERPVVFELLLDQIEYLIERGRVAFDKEARLVPIRHLYAPLLRYVFPDNDTPKERVNHPLLTEVDSRL